MSFPKQPRPEFIPDASISRVYAISQDIIDLTQSDGQCEWSIKVLIEAVKSERYHLFGLYQNGRCLSIGSVYPMDGYTRVDDVTTHLNYRGQGHGTRLMQYLCAYHASISDNQLCLFANNPVAIKMYQNIGFQPFEMNKPCWSARLSEG